MVARSWKVRKRNDCKRAAVNLLESAGVDYSSTVMKISQLCTFVKTC